MNASLDPELVVRCQRWGQLQQEAELYRRHRDQLLDSRAVVSSKRSRWHRR